MTPPGTRDILIADDQPMNLSVLSGLLRERGYHVRAVTNGRKALEAARARVPDLVMLDITMPDLDGYAACQAIKADPRLGHVPVIFISAHDQPSDKVRAFQSGGADYVSKPFHAEEVMARVEHQFRIMGLQRDLVTQNAALLDANLKLQELDRIKASFTAMLVHDLRAPLTAVSLVIQKLTGAGHGESHLLGLCASHVEKALRFLNDLMEVYRAEAQGLALQREPVDCRALLQGVVDTYQVQAAQGGIELALRLEPGLPAIEGDAAKLERVFSNLLTNALKFTAPGGTVTLWGDTLEGRGVETGTRWLQVAVEDTGRGIAADRIPFVFDPYRQALKSDATLGTGLGLAIVARIVAAHRGRVQVQSREGIGSRFTVLLPF
jgi:two-component system sensor histidine kinase/response regulator